MGTLDAVRDSPGRPNQCPRRGVRSVGAHDHPRVPREDQIEFVRVGMGVDRLPLSRLETVETDEQVLAAYDVEFREFVGGKLRSAGGQQEVLGHCTQFG
jgi:hypothetical protein